MRKILTFILILCTVALFAEMRGGALYDPGAMRTGNTALTATGTAALPAYSFASDPDTGIYSAGANTIGIGVGGSQIATLSSSGLDIATPLSVANGGTGATTAAAGLAALGGASLNGSSTVDFSMRNIFASGKVWFGNPTGNGAGLTLLPMGVNEIATVSVLIKNMGKTLTASRGVLTIVSTSGILSVGSVLLKGSSATSTILLNPDGYFTSVKDTPNRINVYSVGGAEYEIQNTHGTLSLLVKFEGN